MKEISKYINEHKYSDMINKERKESFNRIFDVIVDILDNWDSGQLDVNIVDKLSTKDKDIKKFIDNKVTARDFLEELLDNNPVEISDTVAREEIIEYVCNLLNSIKKNCVKYDDLMNAYLLFP